MKKVKIAIILIILAFVIFALVMAFNQWSFKAMFEKDYITNTYEITEGFSNIKIMVEVKLMSEGYWLYDIISYFSASCKL